MKYIYKPMILVFLLGLVSCEKSLEEVNINPNISPTASEAQVLTSAQGFLSYVVDVELNSESFLWAQYYTWGIGVSIGNQERFVAEPDDHDNYWRHAYSNTLTDLKFLTKSENKAYSGIGKALTAYVYQGLVDHFGDVPYSEAIKGEISEGSILTPNFDDAATIYADLVVLLDDAILDLSTASGTGIDGADLVYGGDIAKWQKFAKSLKLRVLMRTSEVSPNADAVKAVISAGGLMENAGDIASIAFDGSAGNQNPMYARFEWGVGDFYFASNTTLNTLADLGDPRSTAFYSLATTGNFAGNLHGIDQGTVDDEIFTNPPTHYSGSSDIAYGNTNEVVLMSPWEVWFLRAEAAARYGTADDDASALSQAVSANFAYWGVDGASDYVASLNYGGSLDEKLNTIGVQKWIALNGTQEDEGWIEARRFDRTGNRLFTDGIWVTPPLSVLNAGDFPASWLYPASERSLNPNSRAQRKLTDKIFWDN